MTRIHRSQPKDNSRNKVNITFPVLITIQFHFSCYIIRVPHIKCQVLYFSSTYSYHVFNKLQYYGKYNLQQ